jgi:hypothetical protein
MTDDRLDEAYLRMHRCGPEWGEDRLTNHGPMAAETLIRRGHGDRVTAWVDRYLTRLDDLPGPTGAIDDAEWREALGRRVADWTAYFSRQVAEHPWREVLAVWWPRLLPGIAAGATHGVIRVGHAVRTLLADGESDGGSEAAVVELAHGLAFWAARFQGVPGVAAPAGRLDAGAALRGIPALAAQHGSLATRLARLPGTPGWTGGLAALRAPATPEDVRTVLADLVAAGTRQYLSHGHASPVLLVHAATAPNAVLHVLPALAPELWLPSLRAVWPVAAALSAAYVAEPDPTAAPTPAEDPASVFDRAAEHGDEHVIKFTDTAIEVHQRTGDPAALAAAVRITTLISPPRAAGPGHR